jgi:hypothetical protein
MILYYGVYVALLGVQCQQCFCENWTTKNIIFQFMSYVDTLCVHTSKRTQRVDATVSNEFRVRVCSLCGLPVHLSRLYMTQQSYKQVPRLYT